TQANANMTPFTNNNNTSYFVGVDATDTNPQMFLTGDHNLGAGNPPTAPYATSSQAAAQHMVSLGTNFPANNTATGWMDNMHQKQGNVGLADGSVQQFSRAKLQEALRNTNDGGQTGPTPGGTPFAVGAGSSPAGVNRIQFP